LDRYAFASGSLSITGPLNANLSIEIEALDDFVEFCQLNIKVNLLINNF
jgi:hypothetical protein